MRDPNKRKFLNPIFKEIDTNEGLGSITQYFMELEDKLAFLNEAKNAGFNIEPQKLVKDDELGEKFLKDLEEIHYIRNLYCNHLINAVDHNNISSVESLIREGIADVNYQNPDSAQTPLHTAARKSNKEITNLLVNAGAIIDAQDKYERTPLHEAVSHDNKEVIGLLIEKHANVNIADIDGRTPLHEARSKEVANLLINNGAKINARDNEGNTPIHTALGNRNTDVRNTDVISLLIQSGAEINAKNAQGETPLHIAILKGNTDVVSMLLENEKIDLTNNSKEIMHTAISKDQGEIIDLLIEKGAFDKLSKPEKTELLLLAANRGNIDLVKELKQRSGKLSPEQITSLNDELCKVSNAQDEERAMALIAAGAEINEKTFNSLIKSGCNLNIEDNNGTTPLSWAVSQNDKVIVGQLINTLGADVHNKNKDGETAFHMAVREGKKESIELLLAHDKTLINTPNNKGDTSLHLAVSNGKKESVELLLAHDKTLANTTNSKGDTPLHLAVSNGNKEMVSLLMGTGKADVTIKNNDGKTAKDIAKTSDNRVSITHILNAKNVSDLSKIRVDNPKDKPQDKHDGGFWQRITGKGNKENIPPQEKNLSNSESQKGGKGR